MATALFSGLPEPFDFPISALDAAHLDDNSFFFDFVQPRYNQEEQRLSQRAQDALTSSQSAALFADRSRQPNRNNSADFCVHCTKHCNSFACYKAFSHLAPPGHPARARLDKPSSSLLATTSSLLSVSSSQLRVCLFFSIKPSIVSPPPYSSLSFLPHQWILDSGCKSHLTLHPAIFFTYYPFDTLSLLDPGAGFHTFIVGSETVSILVLSNGFSTSHLTANVLHVPTLRYQPFSVFVMTKNGISVQFHDHGAPRIDPTSFQVFATATQQNGVYILHTFLPTASFLFFSSSYSFSVSFSLWHQRSAHVNVFAIESIFSRGTVQGLTLSSNDDPSPCAGSVLVKSHCTLIPRVHRSSSTQPFHLVHPDDFGFVENRFPGGAK